MSSTSCCCSQRRVDGCSNDYPRTPSSGRATENLQLLGGSRPKNHHLPITHVYEGSVSTQNAHVELLASVSIKQTLQRVLCCRADIFVPLIRLRLCLIFPLFFFEAGHVNESGEDSFRQSAALPLRPRLRRGGDQLRRLLWILKITRDEAS